MKIDQKLGDRFQELIIRLDELMKTRTSRNGSVTRYPGGGALVSESSDYLNDEMVVEQMIYWVRIFIENSFGDSRLSLQ